MGQLELRRIKSCGLSAGGELVLASEGKCHIIAEAGGPVSMAQWRDAISGRLTGAGAAVSQMINAEKGLNSKLILTSWY